MRAEIAGGGTTVRGELSLVSTAAVLLRHRRKLFLVPLLAAIASVLGFLSIREYEARATFRPESGGQPPGLAGLAAQFGARLGAAFDGEPLEFYVVLLESREILTALLADSFSVATPDGEAPLRAPLIDFLEIDGDTPAERMLRGTKELTDRLGVAIRPDAGVAAVTVRAPWPDLAEQVVSRSLTLLEEFNTRTRQSQAAAERRFAEARVQEAQADLEEAERALERFLDENRSYQESPRLVYEYGRFQRRVDLRQQLYVTLAQAYEQARIDEVRDTPVITVLDPPEGSGEPAGNVLVAGLVGLFAGALAAGAWVLVAEVLAAERRQHPRDYDELATEVRLLTRRARREERAE